MPVDSEHSALAQCLRAGTRRRGAPAGPHRLAAARSAAARRAELAEVTPEQALAHPTWYMGPVVTINSATLVNKGLEVIEAHLLFDVPFDRIDVVVHPQSVVHSMVEFVDGSTIAQASPPDMRLPIALGLGWPDRVPEAAPRLRLDRGRHLDVRAAGRRRPSRPSGWPRAAGAAGGTAPAVYNAANEECVEAFLARPAAVPRHRRHRRPGAGRPPRRAADGLEPPHRGRRPTSRRSWPPTRGHGPARPTSPGATALVSGTA